MKSLSPLNSNNIQNNQSEITNHAVVRVSGLEVKVSASLGDVAAKQREAKENLELEIFNHYFLGFSGNG